MRDRHHRGMRGMLAPPNSIAGQVLRMRRPTLPSAFFFHCVSDAIEMIDDADSEALDQLDVGVDDVPDVTSLWSSHMPLASSVAADDTHVAQIVIYRRPIELRASTRQELRQLVFAALVEQVASMTGRSIDSLDPKNLRGE